VFEEKFYARLAELPIVGGREVMLRKVFDKTNPFLESNNLNSFYIIPNII
jgi:hypothetical protein